MRKLGRLSLVRPGSPQVPLKELGWLESLEPARCGYSGQTSTGNKDNDDGGDNNDVRHTSSTADNNKVSRNTGTGSSTQGNIRNSPVRIRY
jgi:hypothetical protein